MAWDAGAIVSKLTLDRTKFSASMKQVSAQVKSFGSLVKNNSAQIKKMGRQMTVAGGAIVGAMGLMVKAYGSFDESMTRSLAIMGDVSPEMRKEMAKTAKQLSTQSTFAAKDLAEAYYFLASAGMNAEQSISALAPVARFAQAGTFDLALATDLLTDAQTALGLSSKNVIENEKNLIRVSDVLVGANTLANASVLQFSEALTNKAAAAMVNLNMEVEEGVAVLAAYADKGVKGRLAGQRLTMMLNGLFDATRQNKEVWEGVGISLFNADESMRSVADIIQDLEGYLGKMTVKQREAALAQLGFNIKTKDSILTLMGSSKKIRGWTEDLKKMGGITREVADKQMEAFNAKMTVLKNTVMKAAIGIGQSLAPMIESLGEKIKNVAEKIAAWIEWHPKLTAVIATVVTGIGALLLVLGPLMMMLPGIIAALPALKAGLASLLGPLGAIIIAATAVGFALNKLIANYAKKQDAEIDAIINASTAHAKYIALRKKMVNDEIVTTEEWRDMFNKHGRSYKRVLKAISTLPEYAHIKDHWDKIIAKQKEAGKSDTDLGGTIQKNSEETAKLVIKMIDEVMKGTLNEFKYRKWKAQQTYETRKALLEKEKADKQAFLLLEKAYAVELDQIETDRTQKLKEGWAERGRGIMAGLLKWRAAEKKYATIIASYADIIKKATLSEKQYKLSQLDVWYETERQRLKDLYGESQKFYDAMAQLDEAYATKRGTILSSAFAKTVQNILAAVGTVVSAMDNIFSQFHSNQAMRLENEEKQQTDAIESWFEQEREKVERTITNEEEKVAALEALDEEKARKENELQHKMDKERRKLERARAKAQKAGALFAAGINVAEAITKALTAGPLIGQIFAGIVAALGAVQMAAIAAAPLPSLQKGGIVEKEGIYHLHAGEEVRPAPIVMGRMAGASTYYATVNIYAQRLDDRTINEAAEKIHRAVKQQQGRY